MEHWFLTFLYNDRPVVWRLENVHSETEANTKAMEKLAGRAFLIFKMTSADMAGATQHAKAMWLETTANVDISMRRASHQELKPVENNTPIM